MLANGFMALVHGSSKMNALSSCPQILPVTFRRTSLRTQLRPTSIPAKTSNDNDGGIPYDDVKTLAQFSSLHNTIRVLEVSRRADHPFAGSRLLLLDNPGNIHSVSFLFRTFTGTYFDVFASIPPILPPGPTAILGFGAGSAARLLFHLYPDSNIHGWELDPSVISVARKFFGLSKLEKQFGSKLHVHIGNALDAEIENGFAGIFVDLFMRGRLIPELQEKGTWVRLKRKLRRGGRLIVNCGGRCVESEDEKRDGGVLMEETLRVMSEVFLDEMFVLMLGRGKEDSCIAFTGPEVDFEEWKGNVVKELRGYVDMWRPYNNKG